MGNKLTYVFVNKNIFRGTLHRACEKGNIEAVKQFLADVADVNAQDQGDMTPLHHAALKGHMEIAELLIANGADVNSLNEDKKTPLDLLSANELKGVKAKTAIFIRKHGGKTGEELKAAGN